MTATKKNFLQLNTPMGSSTVWITKVSGKEGLSQLFNYKLQLASQQPITNAFDYIGKLFSFSILDNDDQKGRDFNGLLINFSALGINKAEGWCYYEIELAPWLWLLTQRTNCRIFPGNGQRKEITVKDVLEELFTDYASFQVDLTGIKESTINSDFWLQYNETDFQFLSRLTETYGIFYYFVQTTDQHKLMLTDQKQGYSTQTHTANRFYSEGGTKPQILTWQHLYQFVPKTWTLNSHNIEQPSTQLQANSDSCVQHQRLGPSIHYRYTGNYSERDQGTTLSRLRMEAEETYSSVGKGSSSILGLAAGEHLKLDEKAFPEDADHDFIITELVFSAEDAKITNDNSSVASYINEFHCIPATRTFRLTPTTNSPQANQLHEAVVTGTSGEEVYTDNLSRLRVQFTWDVLGTNDANSSCWIRCVAPWEGILRVGTPVLVGFLHNDLNQPIILGALYDSQQQPLYNDPTMSGLKRRHGTQGDESYYNELRFIDKKDSSEVFLHACKDMQAEIDNNLTTIIKSDEIRTIEKSRKTEIKQANDTLTIDQGDLVITVSQGQCLITVQGNVTIKSSANLTLQATQNLTLSGEQISLQAQTSFTQKAESMTINSSDSLTLQGASTSISGSDTVSVKGASTTITGSDSMSVTGASTSITGNDSVSVKGAMIQLN